MIPYFIQDLTAIHLKNIHKLHFNKVICVGLVIILY